MQYCCGAYDWFRNTVLRDEIRQANESGRNVHNLVSEIASKAPAGSGGLIFLPHLLGERAPRWNPNVRGAYIGLSGKTTREELVRSVFEGISYHLALCFDAVNRDGALREVTLIGGGANKPVEWEQMARLSEAFRSQDSFKEMLRDRPQDVRNAMMQNDAVRLVGMLAEVETARVQRLAGDQRPAASRTNGTIPSSATSVTDGAS